MTVVGIVLAGGRSSRYGRDKLAEPLDGRTLLARAIDEVAAVADEVIVVGQPEASPGAWPEASPAMPPRVRVVHDERPFEGPLAGLLTGLTAIPAASGERVLLVGGDMPTLRPDVLRSMLDRLDDPAIDVVALEADGRPRPLPLALRRDPAMVAARAILATGERRLRAILDRLRLGVIAEPTWRRLDPDAATIRDVDRPEDLSADTRRPPPEGGGLS